VTVTVAATVTEPFVHEALLYDSEEDYLERILPFVADGLDAGDAVLIAVPQANLDLLAPQMEGWVDDRLHVEAMEEVGANPAWIIPVWADFVAAQADAGRRVRGVGEPVWSARTPEELVECARHEALLNLAFATAEGFTLMCPYDTRTLDPAVLEEAAHTHPQLDRAGEACPSAAYDGQIPSWLESPLSPVPAGAERVAFDDGSVAAIRRLVAFRAIDAGLPRPKADDAVLAVSEAVTNSIDHAGGHGELALWATDDRFICEVHDQGRITDPLAGRLRPSVGQAAGRGLWLIYQISDLIQLRSLPDGQHLRLHFTR
jgi:anti-sigma regulatory factor (Ser/Thr protein kinase)